MSDKVKVPRFKGVTSTKHVIKDEKHTLTFTPEFLRKKLRLPDSAMLVCVDTVGRVDHPFDGFHAVIEVKS